MWLWKPPSLPGACGCPVRRRCVAIQTLKCDSAPFHGGIGSGGGRVEVVQQAAIGGREGQAAINYRITSIPLHFIIIKVIHETSKLQTCHAKPLSNNEAKNARDSWKRQSNTNYELKIAILILLKLPSFTESLQETCITLVTQTALAYRQPVLQRFSNLLKNAGYWMKSKCGWAWERAENVGGSQNPGDLTGLKLRYSYLFTSLPALPNTVPLCCTVLKNLKGHFVLYLGIACCIQALLMPQRARWARCSYLEVEKLWLLHQISQRMRNPPSSEPHVRWRSLGWRRALGQYCMSEPAGLVWRLLVRRLCGWHSGYRHPGIPWPTPHRWTANMSIRLRLFPAWCWDCCWEGSWRTGWWGQRVCEPPPRCWQRW